jgi:hypothetical protein
MLNGAYAGFGTVSINTYGETNGNGFKASIVDKNTGSPVNSLQSNTVYTLSMYMPGAVTSYDVGSITASGMTTYFSLSSVQANDFALVVQDNKANLPEYRGDVTELGFAEGTTVYTAVLAPRSNMWADPTASVPSMANQAIVLHKAADEDYASVQFSISREFDSAGTYAFFSWAYKADGSGWDKNKTAGYIQMNGISAGAPAEAYGMVIDLETGLKATKFVPGKAYEMRWYGEDITTFKVGCCEQNGETITIYYANATSGNEA